MALRTLLSFTEGLAFVLPFDSSELVSRKEQDRLIASDIKR